MRHLQVLSSRHCPLLLLTCEQDELGTVIGGVCSIEEADMAGDVGSGCAVKQNPQTAGDAVELADPFGGAVSGYALADSAPIHLPGNTDMVGVEPFYHTHQRLVLVLLLLHDVTLVLCGGKKLHLWFFGFTARF